MATLEGTLTEWTVRGRNGWGTGCLQTAGGTRHALVGMVPGAKPGDCLKVSGTHQEHEVYGPQFQVKTVMVVAPHTEDAIVQWLCKLPNLGPARAAALVEAFGTRLWTVIENEPRLLLTVKGLTESRVDEITEAYRAAAHERDANLTLRSLGFKDGLLARLNEYHGSLAEALKAVRENPYSLQRDIRGIGFRIADGIAARLGLFGAHPQRIAAALRWVLEYAAEQGHCFLGETAALELTSRAAGESVASVRGALQVDDAAYQNVVQDEGTGRYWLAHQRHLEERASEHLRKLAHWETKGTWEEDENEADQAW